VGGAACVVCVCSLRENACRRLFFLLFLYASHNRTPVTRPGLDTQISSQILICKKKIPHYIKMSAHIWSTKYR
jgi:hypothetical protein